MEKEFVSLIGNYQAIILKVCRMYGTSHDDNEDLFQEILLQLWKSYPSFKGTAKISTWIYRVGLNTAITRLRRNTRKIHVQQLSFSHENLAESNSPRIDVEYDKELQRAINVLNRFDKAAGYVVPG